MSDNSTIGRRIAGGLKAESATTRKMLSRLEGADLSWRPHEKSMTLGRLAGHIVEMIGWTKMTLSTDELDFATSDYKPKVHAGAADIIVDFESAVASAVDALESISDEEILKSWTMRNGERVFFTIPKSSVIQGFVMNHVLHHRGQLSVYMRLLDIPVPSIYGPSADESV